MSHFLRSGAVAALPRGMGVATTQTMLVTRCSRALGALALGLASPLLAIIPLIDAGPGKDSDCAQLVHDARDLQPANALKTGAVK